MDKLNPTIQVTELDDTTEQKQRPKDVLFGMMQTPITAPDINQATNTYSPGTAAIINNLQTRINELEALLTTFGIIKSR